jgi:hypothetical protein
MVEIFALIRAFALNLKPTIRSMPTPERWTGWKNLFTLSSVDGLTVAVLRWRACEEDLDQPGPSADWSLKAILDYKAVPPDPMPNLQAAICLS